MEKVAFMFPGVGVQNTGMGKNFYDNFKIAKETFEEASEVLNMDLFKMCFSCDEKDKLLQLENSQVALLTVSVAIAKVYMKEIGITPQYCLGHSLGEYSALCNAGVIKFTDAVQIVKQRGEIIKEISNSMDGTMIWVININSEIVQAVCSEVSKEGREVFISAYDSPFQSSISGYRDDVLKVAKKLEKEGALIYPLKLNGPFHSPLMHEAAKKLRIVLNEYEYSEPMYNIVSNYSGTPYCGKESVVNNLCLQLINPIKWQTSVEYLLKNGVDCAIEMGPNNVLKYLIEKNTKDIKAYSISNSIDLTFLKTVLTVPRENYSKIIGKSLGAIVSSKNYNNSSDEYEKEVINSYNKIKNIYMELKRMNLHPDEKQLRQVIQYLYKSLNGKKISVDESQSQIRQIFC